MNELRSERNRIKEEQTLNLDQELGIQDCIEEFDRIIYQIPEEFTICDSSQNLSPTFSYSIDCDDDNRG